MRLAELALTGLPLLLLAAWLCGLRHARWRALLAASLALAALGGALFVLGEQRGFTGLYTPARLQNGRIVPEHGG